MYTKYYLLVIYHVLNFVMITKGCLVSQTMPGFLSFVDLELFKVVLLIHLLWPDQMYTIYFLFFGV